MVLAELFEFLNAYTWMPDMLILGLFVLQQLVLYGYAFDPHSRLENFQYIFY